ncbi:hypothetical protein AQF52_1057 [Streptomyces venezuelae]|uniref:MmpS family transport accessory protein n=1 Tax=Streptomyces gardneri TaxID=66892 RepID=UPI0006BCEA51|nr:MmpS family transport accessory protein [Streptomyces gardneri]ALO06653.1 hypothetical protein AQF52_1057 [Streptomyces venezuelae]QPK44065.1 hypothetical protein H4W23_05190 [Streptomyces gardneri]WRK35337.1 MmpS family transport accessory protein [Streptomyces venezuelae]CUM43064.1 hypothetical protein BN2537_15093 [Streptomyces venezuelae]
MKETRRRGITVAASVLLVGFIGSGCSGFPEDGEQESPRRSAPTAAVVYEVSGEGTVEISYLDRDEKDGATVEKNVALPWKKSVRVPLGSRPSVNIVLDDEGGQARCSLAVGGRHAQSSTASGPYGRATCSSTLPQGVSGQGAEALPVLR